MATLARSKTASLALSTKVGRRTPHVPIQLQCVQTRPAAARSYATAASSVGGDTFDHPSPHPPPYPAQSTHQTSRRDSLKSAKPFSSFLTDSFNRQHDYLRVSITEKCNLRCLYCMPAEGVPLSPKKHLLTPPEIFYLSSLFVSQGVTKIRLTGGEPTIHPQILPILRDLGSLRRNGLRELALTTNGLTLPRKLDAMVESGVTGINLSLDTLDPFQFEIMTRRRGFDQVMKSINQILEMNRMGASVKLKVNAVVIRGLNDEQIIPFVEMTREKDIEVRFIEYMPFDGNKWSSQKMLGYQEMLAVIRERFPDVQKVQDHPNDTSKTFQIPGFEGRLGFITSMTEHFCGSCNRLRITSDGNLKVCLFGNSEVSLRDMLRNNFNQGEPIDEAAWESMRQIEMDRRQGNTEGELGLQGKELELLEVIGMAVKRKKAEHAGIGVLEHMKNRPMILIDDGPLAPPIPRFLQDTKPVPFHQRASRIQPGIHPMRAPHVQFHAAGSSFSNLQQAVCAFSTTSTLPQKQSTPISKANPEAHSTLTHLNSSGEAHMVQMPPPHPPPSISKSNEGTSPEKSHKPITTRTATALAHVIFSNSQPYHLINASVHPSEVQQHPNSNQNSNTPQKSLPKGDVMATTRIAGIMAAKRTADLIPLCHNIPLAGVSVDIRLLAPNEPGVPACPHGGIAVSATVTAHAQTGVEMEALTAATVAGLNVYDMCKAVDRGMSMTGVKVVFKSGGRSGTWREGVSV